MLSQGIGKNAAQFPQVQFKFQENIIEKITHVIVVVKLIVILKVLASVFLRHFLSLKLLFMRAVCC